MAGKAKAAVWCLAVLAAFLCFQAGGLRLVTAASSTSAQSTPPPDADVSIPIKKIMSAQQDAWNRGDIPTFLTGYWNSPELTFAGSEGIVRGYDGLLARYQKSYPSKQAMGQLDFSGLEIRPLSSNAALVLGHWHLTRSSGDVGGVFSLVFKKFPEGWRIVHDHTSAQSRRE